MDRFLRIDLLYWRVRGRVGIDRLHLQARTDRRSRVLGALNCRSIFKDLRRLDLKRCFFFIALQLSHQETNQARARASAITIQIPFKNLSACLPT